MAKKTISMGSLMKFHIYDDATHTGFKIESDANDQIVLGGEKDGADWTGLARVIIYDTVQLVSDLTNAGILRLSASGSLLRITAATSGATVPTLRIDATEGLLLDTAGSDIELTNSGTPIIFGDAETDGSWRLVRSGNAFTLERRESSSWVTKFTLNDDGSLDLLADVTTDVAPNDDTTPKKLSLQKLAAPPTNAAYIAFSNNPGTDTFYLVLEEA